LILQKEQKQQVAEILMMALQSQELHQKTDIDDLWRKLLSIYNLSDVYVEQEEGHPDARQIALAQERGMADARQAVAEMSPEDIMRAG
jgi:hypothetical protein